MKYVIPSMLALFSFSNANAHDTCDTYAMQELKQEVRELRKDIARLEKLVIRLSNNRNDGKRINGDAWGCYLKDLNAGGVYGTGRTEAEAKGKTLERCESKGGICWESNLKCSYDG
ncbi:hypothetical protein MHO82_14660 [Vibrio sp. Of7-15]|uniref:hypothetical protein n=1 Tax=Vibrio sp. Of7-15 TaxID=2724879 RepID=UPI001EF2BFAB|nr:hypothetical protein [Vibrio sp. Of7-15]MCG7498109.1 hypothetical protein [Vibrio sp. Of7-15]